MAEITVITTIKLPDGVTLNPEQIKQIQSIVDNGAVIDPDPNPEIPVCKAAPRPLSVDVVAKNKIIVPWHGDEVEEINWFVKNVSNGSVFDSGFISPKASDNAKLTINLSRDLTAKEYKIQLVATKCKGEGELVFTNKFFNDGGIELEDCKMPPTTKSIEVVSLNQIKDKWHGEGVYKLKWEVFDGGGNSFGSATVEPKASDNATIVMNLTKSLVPGTRYTIVLSGVSCKGGHSYVFEAPKIKEEITIEKIEVTK